MSGEKYYTIGDETLCISDWLKHEKCVVSKSLLGKRLKDDWDFEEALTTPPETNHTTKAALKGIRRFKAFGEEHGITQWIKHPKCVVSIDTLRRRLKEDWEFEAALTTPGETGHSTHGESGTPLHVLWCSIRGRCNTPSATGYERYGGSGIQVCPEWDDFTVFRDWALANGYKKGLTIERKNPKKGYEPDNCEFIPGSENSRRAMLGRVMAPKKLLTAWGETKSRREWLKDDRCTHKDGLLLKDRLRHGWEPEEAISAEKGDSVHPKKGQPYSAFGESKPLRDWWADERNQCKNWATFKARVQKDKQSVEEAMGPVDSRYSNNKKDNNG